MIYRLAEYSSKDRRLEIAIIDDKSINAFTPGGIIGINAGLIYQSNTEGELASVLSHELAHLSQKTFCKKSKDR